MLKSKFPLSRSLRNDTGLVTKRLDVKTFLRANRHAIMPIDDQKWAEIHKYYEECDWSKKWAEGLQKILT